MSDNKKPKEGYYSALTGAKRAVPIILFAAALFVTVCFITNSVGALGQGISSFLRGLFSYGAYAIPLLLILHAIFYAEDVAKSRTLSRIIFSTLTVVLISAIEYSVAFWGSEYPFSPAEFYTEKCAGGFVGSLVAFGLVQFLGSLGVIILALAILAIYVTFFFSGSRSALSRVALSALSAIVGALASLEKWIKSILTKLKSKQAKKQKSESNKKNKEFLDDPFFTADAGLNEINIPELGIHKKIETAGMPPVLQNTVFHKSQVEEQASISEPKKAEPAVTAESKDDTTVKAAPNFSYANVQEDEKGEPTKSETTAAAPHNDLDTSADAIFTKDFDPFDFMASEKEASRPSSKYVPKTEPNKDKPITEISYEDAERKRREDEFARRKEMLIKKQAEEAERAKAALDSTPDDEPKAPVDTAPAVTATIDTVPTAPIVDTTTSEATPSGGIVTATKSDAAAVKTVEFKVDNAHKEEPQPPKQQSNFYATFEKPEKEAPKTSDDAPSYADYILKKVADSTPEYTPSYNETRTYVSVTETTLEPRGESVKNDIEEPVFKPFDPTQEAMEIADVEYDSEPQEGLKIDRTPITVDIFEDIDESEEKAPELHDDDVDNIVPAPDTSLISFDDEEDEEESREITTPPDDDDADALEIPPEQQNPEVIRQRELFPFLNDDVSEEPSDEVVAPLADEPVTKVEAPAIAEEPKPTALVPASEPKKAEKKKADYSDFVFPSIDLLGLDENTDQGDVQAEYQENADRLVETLASFNITASIKGIDRGPRITRYEVVPSRGIKVSSVMSLENDIAMGLAADGIRMEAPIPGKSAIGIEIPNKKPINVRLRELIETEDFRTTKSKTAVCIGKDVAGQPVINDIAKMPHLLIAGATGMGKSVCINSLMISILYKARPDEVKFIMIDPKQVEFTMYNGIPHLLVPVVSDAKKAAGALMWAVEEMERRYNLLNTLCVRNVDAYNEKVEKTPSLGEPMSKIIIVIDEFADLMLQVKDPVENLVMRLAQKARAAGIHLIIGTQRPAVNVITGTIKANVPSRISCKVASNVDSRTVLDAAGAEKLLNKGDMLFSYSGAIKPLRVQGAFVADSEVEDITNHLKQFATGNDYDTSVMEEIERAAQRCSKKGGGEDDDDRSDGSGEGFLNDKQFLDAVEVAVNTGKISTSLIQRKISVGYGKAAKFIDIMEDMGIVGEANGQKPREVLITPDEWREKLARTMLD